MLPVTPATMKVLSVGDDHGLLEIREIVLRKAGYTVNSITSSSVLAATELPEFNIVVLCRSVGAHRAENIGQFLRAYRPGLRIIRLSHRSSGPEHHFDFTCDPSLGPHMLLLELNRIGTGPGHQHLPSSA